MTATAADSKNFGRVDCAWAGRCSGCAWIDRPYADQLAAKTRHLSEALAAAGIEFDPSRVQTVSIAAHGLRDRLDFTIERGPDSKPRFGLYGGSRSEGVLDLESCPALSPALQSWLLEFRNALPSVARGSARLRVAPDGARGAWLDLANADVKALLDDRRDLDRLRSSGAFVEIGQRRKALIERDGRLKLGEPEPRAWFETYLADERPTPLFGPVGGFSQPGFAANRALVRTVREAFAGFGARSAVEFGSGNGNFTLAVASLGAMIVACESDELALAGLERGLQAAGLRERVEVRRGDFQAGGRSRAVFSEVDAVLVDPPRSGLKRFLDPLADTPASSRPPNFLYVSCFAESLALDAARLRELGYALRSLSLVDQFPQSPHYEAVAAFGLG